jgi:hypothetical protein
MTPLTKKQIQEKTFPPALLRLILLQADTSLVLKSGLLSLSKEKQDEPDDSGGKANSEEDPHPSTLWAARMRLSMLIERFIQPQVLEHCCDSAICGKPFVHVFQSHVVFS